MALIVYIGNDDKTIVYTEFLDNGGVMNRLYRGTMDDVNAEVAAGTAVWYDTIAEAESVIRKLTFRRQKYPPMGDQLDQIYHEGLDSWKATIKGVKDANPK